MKISINWDRCEGHAQCALIAPEVFRLDDEDNVQIIDEALAQAPVSLLEDAVAMCPAVAIRLEQ
jgi:ferredoxin